MPKYPAIVLRFLARFSSAAGMNTKEPESADDHCLSELEPSITKQPRDEKVFGGMMFYFSSPRRSVCLRKPTP